jgi:hypothetical protein
MVCSGSPPLVTRVEPSGRSPMNDVVRFGESHSHGRPDVQ